MTACQPHRLCKVRVACSKRAVRTCPFAPPGPPEPSGGGGGSPPPGPFFGPRASGVGLARAFFFSFFSLGRRPRVRERERLPFLSFRRLRFSVAVGARDPDLTRASRFTLRLGSRESPGSSDLSGPYAACHARSLSSCAAASVSAHER